MAAVLWVVRIVDERATSRQSLRLVAVMIATVSVLMAAHIAEVVVWSLAYMIVGAAPPGVVAGAGGAPSLRCSVSNPNWSTPAERTLSTTSTTAP